MSDIKKDFILKGENLKDHKRRERKKHGAGSAKGSRRRRKGRLIEDALIGKHTVFGLPPTRLKKIFFIKLQKKEKVETKYFNVCTVFDIHRVVACCSGAYMHVCSHNLTIHSGYSISRLCYYCKIT